MDGVGLDATSVAQKLDLDHRQAVYVVEILPDALLGDPLIHLVDD